MLNLRFRTGVVWSAVAAALLAALPLFGVACGGGEPPRSEKSHDEEVGKVAVQLPPPLPAIETTEPEEIPVVAAPEVPAEVSYEDAEGAFLERRYDEAVEMFTRYTDRRPANPWGYYMLGLSAWKAGDFEVAEESFDVALELDAQHVKSWLNLGRVLLDTGRPEQALETIDEALAIDSESGVAYRLQGRAHHQLGQIEEAIDAYRQAILIDDEDPWSMNNMGLILIEEGRFGEAMLPLARAVELKDDVAFFQNNLGIALENIGHLKAAQEAYKSAVAVDGTHEKAFTNLARVEGLEEDPSLDPVDLGELAQSFIAEVEGWREAVATLDAPEVIELEPVIVSAADTTEIKVSAADTTEIKVSAADTTEIKVSAADTTEIKN
jgi:Flp pilus assembly protein TadD